MKPISLIKCLASAMVLYSATAGAALAHDFDGRWHEWRPAPAPYEVVHNYNYVYYPSQQVYYSPDNGAWYWSNGRGWVSGFNLPYSFRVDLRNGGVPVVLRSPRPYVEHAYVEQTYGRPWREGMDWRRERHAEREWREDRHEHHHDRD